MVARRQLAGYHGLDKTDGKLLKVRPGAEEPPVAVGAFYGSAVPYGRRRPNGSPFTTTTTTLR